MTIGARALACWLAVLVLVIEPAAAKVSPEEAAALGKTLTPMGSEAAGNAAGTIPKWEPLAKADLPRSADPFAAEKPLYTITAKNVAQHQGVLTEGYKALFKTFPDSYKMNVYPSHRTAAYPQWFYDATKKNATTVELTNSGYGFCCSAQGYPFPIPKNGTEVMWNHIMRYNTTGYRGYLASAATAPDGAYVIDRGYIELAYVYNNPKTKVEAIKNQNLYLMVKTVSPPSKAGEAVLLHVPLDRVEQTTGVWSFSTGTNRSLRIGEVGYDNPAFDGLMTQDQIDMFNGPLDRYSIKLLGKKELLVPYNSYKLYSDKLKYKDIITKGHINQDVARYELHRVWVIEANVKEGVAHRYKKRVFYVDEDSWIVLAQDMYDERDQFWRTAESHAVNFAAVPVVVNGVQVHYDLQSRRYVIINLTNEEKKLIEYDWTAEPNYFSPANLKRFATARQM